ncbi:MAG: D-aminoacylase [Chloroflexi bacterium]|nr:D-aminoacylase [Chloroflexota bacterium]
MYDLIIRNGTIVDGSGAPAFSGDVAVQGGKIVETGEVSGQAKRVIDAKGQVVAPGIVDIHTHYDHQVLWDPLLTSSLWHGVTTLVMGNCGFTIAPCKPEDRDYLMRMLARVEGMSLRAMQEGPPWEWVSMADYMRRVEQRLSVNVACQVGHSAVRYHVMGEEAIQRQATPEEIGAMKAVVLESLRDGAVGFTTSLSRAHVDWEGNPVPSRFCDAEELQELGGAVGEFGFGAIEIAPRGGLDLTEEDQEEILALATRTRRFITWNELSESPRSPKGRWKEMLDFMERAHAQGARIYGVCSCRPTTQDFDLKDNNLVLTPDPVWLEVLPKPEAEKRRMLADPAYRAQMRSTIGERWGEGPAPRWDTAIVSGPRRPEHQELKGLTLRQLGERHGKHPLDAMIDLSLAEDLKTEFTFLGTRNNDPDAIAEIIRSPYSILGVSDAGAHTNMIAGAEYSTQVLSQWVREKKVLSLEQAIHKMTWMPAKLMGFTDRGLLKPGMAADVIVFDPDTVGPMEKEKVSDLPGGEERIAIRAKGIAHTIVNGEPLTEGGEHTGSYPGRLIRSTDYARAG